MSRQQASTSPSRFRNEPPALTRSMYSSMGISAHSRRDASPSPASSFPMHVSPLQDFRRSSLTDQQPGNLVSLFQPQSPRMISTFTPVAQRSPPHFQLLHQIPQATQEQIQMVTQQQQLAFMPVQMIGVTPMHTSPSTFQVARGRASPLHRASPPEFRASPPALKASSPKVSSRERAVQPSAVESRANENSTTELVQADEPGTYKTVQIEKPVVLEKIIEVEKIKEVPVEKVVEVPFERRVEVPVEKIVEIPVSKFIEVPVEKFIEVPIDKLVQVPVETQVQIPVEKMVTVETLKAVEVPVVKEVPVSVIKEVEVDRVSYQDRIVYQDRIQNCTSEILVPIEKIVYQDKTIEVPVERVCEKVVYRDKPVEVPVDKVIIKEIPIEVHIEKRIEVPIPVERFEEIEKRVVEHLEMPVEKVVRVEVCVPVEKLVYKEVPVIVEKIVEKITIQEVPVEKIVDKIVVQQVPVEKIIEMFVDRPVVSSCEKVIVKEVLVMVADTAEIDELKIQLFKLRKELKESEKERAAQPEVFELEKTAEKIVEVVKVRIVEVEKVVEREVLVEKVVVKEVLVDRIVTVTQEVPIAQIVEKEIIVEKIVAVPGPERIIVKEVPVEKLLTREVPVEKLVYVNSSPPLPAPQRERALSVHSAPPTSKRKVGVGLSLARNAKGSTYVEAIVPGFAADLNGQFRDGDIILSVDGIEVQGHSLEAVKQLTMGEEKTFVRLDLVREGFGPYTVNLARHIPMFVDSSNGEAAQALVNLIHL